MFYAHSKLTIGLLHNLLVSETKIA